MCLLCESLNNRVAMRIPQWTSFKFWRMCGTQPLSTIWSRLVSSSDNSSKIWPTWWFTTKGLENIDYQRFFESKVQEKKARKSFLWKHRHHSFQLRSFDSHNLKGVKLYWKNKRYLQRCEKRSWNGHKPTFRYFKSLCLLFERCVSRILFLIWIGERTIKWLWLWWF